MTPGGPELAVVVPAFKPDFFPQTLASVAAQTDRRFRLYVGVDGSVFDPAAEIGALAAGLDVVQRRFPKRLGPLGLSRHWQRCIEMTSEPWVWLFGDDDRMGAGCVADFHRALDLTRGGYDVYRFNCSVIDRNGALVGPHSLHPRVETAREFLLARLRRTHVSVMPVYVFARGAYEREGGLVHLPLAWNADDASCYRFARRTGVHTLDGGVVEWRLSDINLSSPRHPAASAKLRANLRFVRWIRSLIDAGELGETRQRRLEVLGCTYSWFLGQLPHTGLRGLRPAVARRVGRVLAATLDRPLSSILQELS